MSTDKAEESKRLAALANQGQAWKFAHEAITFNRPGPLFDIPMEISLQRVRGLRMVDETIVVHGTITKSKGEE